MFPGFGCTYRTSQPRVLRPAAAQAQAFSKPSARADQDGLRAQDKGAVHHFSVHHIGADGIGLSRVRGLHHLDGMGNVGLCGLVHGIGQFHLARVNAGLSQEAEAARKLGLGPKALGILDIGESPVIGVNSGLGRRHAHGKHGLLDGAGLAAVHAESLKQIAQTQLQADHAGMGASQLGCRAQGFGRLDIEQQIRCFGDAIGKSCLRNAFDGVKNVL